MDDRNARKGELAFQRNRQAVWRAGVVAFVVAGPLVPLWLLVLDRLVPMHWGLYPQANYQTIFKILVVSGAVASFVALRVAQRRQPRGARISWDEWGITEWDGDGARVAIAWSEATVAARCDTGGDSLALMVLNRAHLSGFAGGDGENVIGLTLRIQGEHGRVIWVSDGVQTPALAGRLNTVKSIAPLLAALKGVRVAPMGEGHPGENLLALFYLAAIGGYVCATLGLGILISKHTVSTYAPHFLGGSVGFLALRALLPYVQRRRLAAEERKLRGAKRVKLVDNDGTRLIAEDEAGERQVIYTTLLGHPDGRLHVRRGDAFMVLDRFGKVLAVETAAVREARRIYQRAITVELVLRAALMIPVLIALWLFHSRVMVSKPWTPIVGPYKSRDTAGALLADGSRALIATHTSTSNDVALFDLSVDSKEPTGSLDLGLNNKVEALALAPTGTRAVVSSGRDTFVWDVSERRPTPRGSLAAAKGIVAVAFSPDGEFLLTGAADGAVSVWETDGFERGRTFTGHTGEVLALSFSDDGALAVSGGADGTARLLDLRRGTEVAVLAGPGDRVQAVAFLGETVVTGASDGEVRFFSPDGALARAVAAHRGGVTAIGIHGGGAFATGGGDHVIRVWDRDWRSEGSEQLAVIDMHTDEKVRDAGTITGVAFSTARPDLVVSMSHGMLLRIDLTSDDP